MSNSALVIAAGCAVVFMFVATLGSLVMYYRQMKEATELLKDSNYSDYDYYVVMITSDDSSDFWQQVYQSAKDYGEDNGVYVDLMSENINLEYSKQELLEMAIASGCDGIILEGDDLDQTETLLDKARNAGITVITLQTDVDSENRISYISANNYSIATLYGQKLVDTVSDNDSVVIIDGSKDSEDATNQIVASIREYLGEEGVSKLPDFDVNIIESDETFATEEYVQNLFKKNQISPIVICLDEVSTACVYQAMIDYNKVGAITLLGYYQSDTILTGISQGVIDCTVSIDTDSMGQSAVEAYLEYINSGYVSDYISVEAVIIDGDNVMEYIGEVADE